MPHGCVLQTIIYVVRHMSSPQLLGTGLDAFQESAPAGLYNTENGIVPVQLSTINRKIRRGNDR